MQQVQEVAADGVVVGLDVDAPAVVAKWYQYSSIEPSDAIRRSAMSRAPATLWSSFSGQHAAERGDAGAHHVHRVRRGGQLLERGLHVGGQAAQRPQLGLVAAELGARSAACRAPAGSAISSNSHCSAISRMS